MIQSVVKLFKTVAKLPLYIPEKVGGKKRPPWCQNFGELVGHETENITTTSSGKGPWPWRKSRKIKQTWCETFKHIPTLICKESFLSWECDSVIKSTERLKQFEIHCNIRIQSLKNPVSEQTMPSSVFQQINLAGHGNHHPACCSRWCLIMQPSQLKQHTGCFHVVSFSLCNSSPIWRTFQEDSTDNTHFQVRSLV